MEWLILGMIIVAGIIYLLMKKLDRLIELPKNTTEPYKQNMDGKAYTLIFGDSQIANSLIRILNNYRIDFLQIKDESLLDKTKYYNHLFAVSNNDLSNMLVSIILNQLCEDCTTIAVCNQIQDGKIYEQNNIPYLLAEESSADSLFNIMYPTSKV
ncbi:MAG: hypothetical protein K0R46_2530 [Herbinix sp.]|nr:hypothetical protein [Herbinix sp.]